MSAHQTNSPGESGQTMAEYTVVLGVITLAIVVSFSLFSQAVGGAFDRTLDLLKLIA